MDPDRVETPLAVDDPDALGQVLSETARELAETEARLGRLLERATALASRSEQERSQLQRFLEEFALGRALDDEPTVPSAPGSGPVIDVQALRRGAQELTDDLNRSSALRGTLATAVGVVRGLRGQFAPDRAFRPFGERDDVEVQQAMNLAREAERRRLAREIHDGPAQVLANAIFGVDAAIGVARRTPDQLGDELVRLREMLRDGVADVRRFVFGLRPTMLEDQGLPATLRHFVRDYQLSFGIPVELAIAEGVPPLSEEEALGLFRIVQEALQNVRKHAATDRALIRLEGSPGRLELWIEDQGSGFDPAAVVPRPESGAGLPGIQERARLIGATVSIASEPGVGTSVAVSLPLRAAGGGGTAQ